MGGCSEFFKIWRNQKLLDTWFYPGSLSCFKNGLFIAGFSVGVYTFVFITSTCFPKTSVDRLVNKRGEKSQINI